MSVGWVLLDRAFGIFPTLNMICNVCTASLLLIRIRLSAESPHWSVLRGQMHQAYQSLCQLRKTEIQAARYLYRIYIQTVPEQQHHRYTSLTATFCQLFTFPKTRRALLSSTSKVLLIKIQPTFTKSLDRAFSRLLTLPLQDEYSNLSVALSSKFVEFILSLFSGLVVETYGRRGTLMRTMPHMLWAGLLLAILSRNYYIPASSKLAPQCNFWILQISSGCVPVMYSAQVLPLGHRGEHKRF